MTPNVLRRLASKETPGERETIIDELLTGKWASKTRGRLHYARGLARYRQGIFKAASGDLEKAQKHVTNRDHALFIAAESNFHSGQYKTALRQYRRLIKRDPLSLWRHRAQFRLADCWLGQGKYRRAAQHLVRLLKTYPDYPHPVALRFAIGQAYSKGKRPQAAAQWYYDAVLRYPKDPFLPTVKKALSDLAGKKIRPTALSVQELLAIGTDLRRRKHFLSALALFRELHNRQGVEADLVWKANFQIARTYLQQERFEDALALFRTLGASDVASSRSKRARRWSAYTLEQMGQGMAAEEAYRSSLGAPDQLGLDALHRLWRMTFDCGMYERASWFMNELVSRSDRWLRRTRFIRAWQSYRGGEYLRAIEQLQALASKSRRPAKYLYWQARSYLNLGHEPTARSMYMRIADEYPRSYYAYQSHARLRELNGQESGVLTRVNSEIADPVLGFGALLLDPWALPMVLFPSSLSKRFFEAGYRIPSTMADVYLRPLVSSHGRAFSALRQAHEFAALGEFDLAKFALRRISDELREFKKASRRQKKRWRFTRTPFVDNRKGSDRGAWGIEGRAKEKRSSKRRIQLLRSGLSSLEHRLLSTAFFALDDFYYGRRHARRPNKKEMDRASYERLRMRRRYPRSFQKSVLQSAAHFDIEPELLWAFITVESAHNPRAISRAGARGLLQVMPHTGELSARTMGWHNFGVSQLYEAESSISMAAWYISELLEKFRGQKSLAMAGYNAGPHRVALWLRRKGDLPMDEFIEEIPYREAREYGKKVLRYLMIYRTLYGSHRTDWISQTIDPSYKSNINF